MKLARRCLVILALMFWQGGFMFYASVVVPVGQSVLGSHRRQGFITQQVTDYLNYAGCVALVPLVWDIALTKDTDRRRRLRMIAWWTMAIIQISLLLLHIWLDRFLDADSSAVNDLGAFVIGHRWYLRLSTLQWLGGVVYLAATILSWRYEDATALIESASNT